jgi:cell division protein FtsZ
MNTNEIKIIGVGSAGHQVLERIPFGTIKNTNCIVCYTDAKALSKSSFQNKIQLGKGIIKSLSIGNQIELGMNSALNSEVDLATNSAIDGFDQINSLFGGNSKTAILIASLGDTTGAGATPVIVQIAKKRGLFVVAIVYTPFDFQGESTKEIANKSLKKLREDCDFVLVIKHSKIGKLYGNLSFKNSFRKADEIVIRMARIVLPMGSINTHGLDLELFFKKHRDNQPFFIGIGDGNGANRAKDAIELALKNTLSEKDTFEGVSSVLLQINYGSIEMTIDEIGEIDNAILNAMENKEAITMFVSEDISLGNAISVMVIAY